MEAFYTEYTGFFNATATSTAGQYNFTVEIGVNVNAPTGTEITYISPEGPASYGMTAWLIVLCVVTVVIVIGVVVFCIVKKKKAHEVQQETAEHLTSVEEEELSKSIQAET